MTKKVSCIIPFYNEGQKILDVVKVLSRTKGIGQIICVDDGSTDSAFRLLKKAYPAVTLIRLEKNQGKSAAVRRGLQKARYNTLLLMDADLINLQETILESAIQQFHTSKDIDLILLDNRMEHISFDPFVFLSGQRLIRKKDLQMLFNTYEIAGYQLEVAMNDFMISQDKKALSMKNSTLDPYKIKKVGLVNGMKNDLKMFKEIISYVGFVNFCRQALTFGRKRLKTETLL